MKQKKSISIRLKLMMSIIPIVLLIIISFFTLSRNVVLEVSQDKLEAKSQAYAGEINAWVTQIFGELQIYQDTIEEGNFADDAAILKYMEKSVDKNEAYPVGLYMGDDSGVYLDGSGWVPGDDWVLEEREWYVDGKENDTFAFGEPYYDSMTGQVCVSASVHVDYPEAVRVLATDVYLDYVSGLIADIAAQKEVEAFLVTGASQTIIAHPNSEMIAVTLGQAQEDTLYGNIGKALSEGKSGLISVEGNQGVYYACLNPVAYTDWYLVTYVTEQQMLSELHKMEFIMAVIAAVAAVALIFISLRIMNSVVRPVKKMTNVIDRIAEGDFSQNLEVKGNDEIARMSHNMQMFITRMQNTISELSKTADWLSRQSGENEKVSDSLKVSSENQAQAVDVLDRMVNQLSAAVQECSSQMEQLAELIGQAHKEGENADSLMKESVVMSQSGKRDMDKINSGMSGISTSIAMLSDQITKVGNAMAQIGDMVNMIMDIAEETNLLSLNASIEAARAGEAGRGFAVVAEQIGKLAVSSGTAADDISRLTVEIRETVDKAVEQMEASVLEVKKNVETVSGASATFEGLYQKVDETSHRVDCMIGLVEQVNDVAGQVEQITESQVEAAEQIVVSADILNEHTRNVTDGSNTVARNAEELKKESADLMDRMSQFKV